MARLHVFHADQGHNVARLGRFHLFPVVGVHFHNPADPLGLARGGVEDGVALLDLTRVEPGEGEGTKAVVHDLEGQGAEGLLRIHIGETARGVTFQVDFGLGRHFRGAGQIINDGI